jgi:hypothetical protein
MKTLRRLLYFFSGLLVLTMTANATPYASGLTNNGNGTMSFWLNESGGAVTITYEDSSVDSVYNGATFNSGKLTFNYGSHVSYTISIYKVGAGQPTLISNSAAFTPRGIAVNSHPASPYFGRVYASDSGFGGIAVMNPDMTSVYGASRTAGVGWDAGSGFSPYRIYIAADDSLFVGDGTYTATGFTPGNAGVFWIDPTVSSNKVFLGPIGEQNGLAAGVFGTVMSKPLIFGNPSTGLVTLMQIDGDFSPDNSILVYSNINPNALPYEQAPTVVGPEVGLNLSAETLGGNSYPGLYVGGVSNFLYASTYRNNLSNPNLQIYDSTTLAPIWNSYYNGSTADYFVTTGGNGATQGLIDVAVSPDSNYVVGVSYDNWFVICPLTNGIPNTANIVISTPTAYTTIARGIAFDAADNIYLSSSGLGECQSWSLGLTTTAITSGNTTGSTGFQLITPNNGVYVNVVSNSASQGGVDGVVGTPIVGGIQIVRTNANNDYSTPMVINFTLAGSAGAGVYTLLPSGLTVAGKNTITLPAGVISTNITIVPTTNNVPRAETTVTLTVTGGSGYTVDFPSTGTVNIQNTSSNEMILTAGAATMYKAFSNDYASATITRLGDTNVSVTIPASAFTYSGTAVSNIDFVPVPSITFAPGSLTHAAQIFPLSNGVPPIDVANPQFIGNKSVTVTLTTSAGAGYSLGTTATGLTIIDNAYPPTPVTVLSDPLTDPNDATNWNITFGSVNQTGDPNDYNVNFGYDLTANNPNVGNNGQVGLPPNGSTTALRINCCQNLQTRPGYQGAVNVYYTNAFLRGNYAVRFYMNNVEGYGQPSLENQCGGPLIGINHNGRETNWWEGQGYQPQAYTGPWSMDGIWHWIDAAPGSPGAGYDYQEYVGVSAPPNTGSTEVNEYTASTFSTVFKDPNVYTTFLADTHTADSGDPANVSTLSSVIPAAAENNWADVELKQINGIVTLSINHTPIFVYTNTSVFTSGYLMLGYCCPFMGAQGESYNSPDQAAYFSDLAVVEMGPDIVTEPSPLPITVGAGTNFSLALTTGFASSSVTNQLETAAGVLVGAPVVVSSPGGAATVTDTGLTNGSYVVVATDASGSATSSVVAVTIISAPGVTTQPVSITNNVGATVSFTAVFSGSAASYHWYSNNVALVNGGGVGGATTATLTLTNITVADDATYKLTASNLAGAVTTIPVTLTAVVPSQPVIGATHISGSKFGFQFTGDPYDTTNSFNLQVSTNLALPLDGFTNTSSATFTVTNGTFTVQIATNGAATDTFYRLQHK